MIELVLALLLQFSVLQNDGVKTQTSVNENKTTTQTKTAAQSKTTTTTTPTTTDPSIGSGGWDDRD